MADLSQTAANVTISGSSTPVTRVIYGESITQGMVLYKSTTDSKYYKCDADSSTKVSVDGIALTPGSTDEYGLIATPGRTADESLVNLGATLTVGETYIISGTAGKIRPVADLTSAQYGSIVGIAKTSALLNFQTVTATAAKA